MAVSIEDIRKLKELTGVGLTDAKKALVEADGDFDKAMEIIRKKGQAVAAKRSDREASEGCVLAKTVGEFSAIHLFAIIIAFSPEFVADCLNARFPEIIVAVFTVRINAAAAREITTKAIIAMTMDTPCSFFAVLY